MISQTFVRKFLRPKKVTIKSYLDPDFYCPEMRSYELLYKIEDVRFPNNVSNKLFQGSSLNRSVNPVGIQFNDSEGGVRKALHTPFLTVNNDDNIRNHIIMLYKRRIGKYKTTTQVHLVNNRVFLVREQFARIYINNVSYVDQIVRSLGLDITSENKGTLAKDKGSGPPGPLVFFDRQGNMIRVEESITINVRYQLNERGFKLIPNVSG